MLDPMKNKPIGPEEVMEKFGVAPDKVVDVQALAGDSIDNVPGVPGIGVKTAAQLIDEYGDLETLLERAGEIKQPKRREALIDNAELARISRAGEAATIDVPLPSRWRTSKVASRTPTCCWRCLEQQGFRRSRPCRNEMPRRRQAGRWRRPVARASPAKRRGGAPAPAAATNPRAQFDGRRSYELIQTRRGARRLDRGGDHGRHGRVRHRDRRLTRQWRAGRRLAGGSSPGAAPAYIAARPLSSHGGAQAEGSLDLGDARPDAPPQLPARAKTMAKLKPLLEDPAVLKVGQNIKYDIARLRPPRHRGWRRSTTPCCCPSCSTPACTATAWTIWPSSISATSRSALRQSPAAASAQVSFDQVPLDKARDYAAEDADVTLRLLGALKPRLAPERMTSVYETIERPLIPVLADMERPASRSTAPALSELSRDFAQRHGASSRRRSTSSPAGRSTSARPSSSARSCSTR